MPCDIDLDEWADCVDELTQELGNESDERARQSFGAIQMHLKRTNQRP